jgi:hypothetical protein
MAKAAYLIIGLCVRFFDFKCIKNVINCCVVTFYVIKYKRVKTRIKLEFINNLNDYLSNILVWMLADDLLKPK